VEFLIPQSRGRDLVTRLPDRSQTHDVLQCPSASADRACARIVASTAWMTLGDIVAAKKGKSDAKDWRSRLKLKIVLPEVYGNGVEKSTKVRRCMNVLL
jgi:hypothetical protein